MSNYDVGQAKLLVPVCKISWIGVSYWDEAFAISQSLGQANYQIL